jgi:hypothetical protein
MIGYLFSGFAGSHPYVVASISGCVGALVAIWLVRRFFAGFIGEEK